MIKSEIASMMRSSNRQISTSQQDTINKLQDAGDRLANTIDFEKRNIQTMEEQIHNHEAESTPTEKSYGRCECIKGELSHDSEAD